MVDHIRLGLTSGFVSVAFWIVVYTPQIWECIVLQSGEGLSVVFLLIWLTGDITGVVGAVIQGLTPTISLLGLYYTACDIVLLCLIYYYRRLRATHPERFEGETKKGSKRTHSHSSISTSTGERRPLLVPPPNGNGNGHAAPYRNAVQDDEEQDDDDDELALAQRAARYASQNKYALLAYAAAASFIVTVGLVAWFTSAKHSGEEAPKDEAWSTPGQIVGWISAFLYLGSRIPQIMKNRKTKCQGLSLMMFCLSVLGNITYCGAILFPSSTPEHVWLNLSWLVGAAGTIVLDFIVLAQFVHYRKERDEQVFIVGGDSEIYGI